MAENQKLSVPLGATTNIVNTTPMTMTVNIIFPDGSKVTSDLHPGARITVKPRCNIDIVFDDEVEVGGLRLIEKTDAPPVGNVDDNGDVVS